MLLSPFNHSSETGTFVGQKTAKQFLILLRFFHGVSEIYVFGYKIIQDNFFEKKNTVIFFFDVMHVKKKSDKKSVYDTTK